MTIKKIDYFLAQVVCDDCQQPVTNIFMVRNGQTIQRGTVICPECLSAVPDDTANEFFQAIASHVAKSKQALNTEQSSVSKGDG